ncbi:hypothetical protein EPUS_00988 [Endocarpon pusillum Z07020]|uniref:Elongin-A n=1 Tax=Endocarpon pusillum (strain Z07020 / HMAS-L-300199) TaxID=1263415 RepID=U1HWH1_ENDPU|nr:uncharacterized protein EPUS_00988 [Endocarpon pusillum Z07020]ERF73734.1 hypothetical protein EPUS_00988 [Endocarpon pusillum Z07020]
MESHGARSLAFLAQKACIKSLKRIDDIGDCPYELIRPVLLKLENPDQLHQLEINCPHLVGRVDEIWLQLIKRDIPDWQSKPHRPKDPKNWWKVYKKLKEQTEKDREQGAEKLKAALDIINDEREQNLAKVLSRKELPKEPINYKAKTLYNYNSGKTGSKSGHKLTLLEKIRKEARNARLARMNQPVPRIANKATEVKQAPRGFVEDQKLLARQKTSAPVAIRQPTVPRVAKPPIAIVRQEKPASDKAFLEREERLRALTEGRRNKAITISETSSPKTDAISKGSTASQALSRPQRPLPQSDGADDEDMGGTQASSPITRRRNQNVSASRSTPKHHTGTPPSTRFASPPPPPKRKAEPSIFMSLKKPKAT